MAKSIKTNFIFNLINTVSSLLFPLITFPYASRIIMAEGIGQVQFYTSIVNYIVLFTCIGIPLYGIREIARVRDDKNELSRTTLELLSLNLILNLLGYLVVIILCLSVDRIQENIPLFLILSSSIVLTTIGCSWFYSGVEEFKYITIRGICIKIISVAYLLLAVKTQDDLIYYGVYTVIGSIGNNVLNFFRLRKYVSIHSIKYSELRIFKHFKPACAIFAFNLVTSIYINLDKVMLGFLQNDEAVGYYTASSNLSHVLLYMVISLGTVLLPRSSNMIKNNQIEDFKRLSTMAYHFIVMIALPIVLGCICLSEPLINLFCGKTFAPSVLTLQILSPIIVFIGISNIIGMQVLYPLGKIKLVTLSTCVGAVVNLCLNVLLIPSYSQYGASIATVAAEFSVLVAQIVLAKDIIPFKIFDKKILLYVVSAVIMYVIVLQTSSLTRSDVSRIIITPIIGSIIYGSILLAMKDSLALKIMNSINISKKHI